MFDSWSELLDTLGFLFGRTAVGLPATIWAVVGGIGLTVVLSFAAGIGLLSRRWWIRIPVRFYVEGFRGSSEIVQLFFFGVAVAIMLGFSLIADPLSALGVGIAVLGLNHGSYGSEIVRGAIQSVPRAQYEGAIALNLPPAQRMWRVILPQAVVEMLPSFNNLFIQLVKATSLLSFIQIPEITKLSEELRPTITERELALEYGLLLVLYLLISVTVTFVMRFLERLAARRVGRMPPARDKALAKGGA